MIVENRGDTKGITIQVDRNYKQNIHFEMKSKTNLGMIICSSILLAFLVGCQSVTSVSVTPHEKGFALWGGSLSRNMVSDEKNIPAEWDIETGENIKWTAELGSQSYAGPLIIGGKIFVGTNNEALYNPKLTGDRGNIIAFNESDGQFSVANHPYETHLWSCERLAASRNLFYTIY